MDRLQAMEGFVTWIEGRSLATASERLGTSKSIISRRVAELEAHLNVKLINRTTRHLSLTDVGAVYFQHAKRLLAELKDAEESAAHSAAAPSGLVRLAAPTALGKFALRRMIVNFMRRWPEIEVHLELCDRPTDLTSSGIDLAVRQGALPDSNLITRALAQQREILCASPDYLRARGEVLRPEDLRHHDCLASSHLGSPGQWTLCENGRPRFFPINTRLRCNSDDMIHTAAVSGLGVALLPEFLAAADLAAGRLRTVLTGFSPPDTPVSLVYVRDNALLKRVRLLIDALVVEFAAPQPGTVLVALGGTKVPRHSQLQLRA